MYDELEMMGWKQSWSVSKYQPVLLD